MDYEYWTRTINEQDRKINNANRRFCYHCYSLESMSEELIYQERSIFPQNDFTIELFNEDFIDTVQNEKLAKALRHLTDRQQQGIELAFWEGYQYKEIAKIFQRSPAAVTLMLKRAFQLFIFINFLSLPFNLHGLQSPISKRVKLFKTISEVFHMVKTIKVIHLAPGKSVLITTASGPMPPCQIAVSCPYACGEEYGGTHTDQTQNDIVAFFALHDGGLAYVFHYNF